MKIGIPKEIKNNEYRVSTTPAGVKELINNNHRVFVQKSAGVSSNFSDKEYKNVGAIMVETIEDVYAQSDMIIKVKEPIEEEYPLIRKGQIVFTFFHFAASKPLTTAMLDSGSICIAYETISLPDHSLPLLIPMSEVAGRMAVQEGAKYLEKPQHGKGILLGGVPGVLPAKVMILGGGVVGTQAAKVAAGLGAEVSILDINLPRLRYLSDVMPANVKTLYSNKHNIGSMVKGHDLIIGAILIAGAKAPHLITKDMLKDMQPGTVIVDVAVDQGGCIETCKPTTHDNPIFIVDDVVHYCVANMPGAVPYTSTIALTNATLPYAIKLANEGWKTACKNNPALVKGLNIAHNKIYYKEVAEAFDMDYHPISSLLHL